MNIYNRIACHAPSTHPRADFLKRFTNKNALTLAFMIAVLTATVGLQTASATTGRLSAAPSTANIGNVLVGSEYSTTVGLNNSGTTSITFSKISVTGAGFSLTGLTTPSVIYAGRSIYFTVHFAPVTTGTVAGSLVITSDASNSMLRIGLSGTGVAGTLSATPSSASFGSVVIGDSDSQTIRLNNTGKSSVTISHVSTSGVGFKIADLTAPRVIPAGGSATFNALFAPTVAGSAKGIVSLTSGTAIAPFTILLTGTAVASTSLLGAMPTSLNFGTLNVDSDNSLSVTLTNRGNSNVTISKVAISGAGLSQSNSPVGITLAPNQSTKINIVFKPVSAGTIHGSATVTSTAANSPTTISLAGTATPQAATRSVALDWNASTSSGVIGYNVYRGTTSGGPYTKLTPSAVASTDYTDASVASDNTYYYVVTSVNSTGVESGHSAQVSVNVPAS